MGAICSDHACSAYVYSDPTLNQGGIRGAGSNVCVDGDIAYKSDACSDKGPRNGYTYVPERPDRSDNPNPLSPTHRAT